MFYYGSCYVIGSQPTDTTVTVYVRHADELTRLCASGIMSTDIYVDIIMSELFNGQFESFTHYCENGRVISGVIGNGNWQQGRICSGSGGVTVPT